MTAKAAGAARGDWRTSIGLRLIFAIVLVAAGGYAIWYHNHYYVWPGQPAGSRISWCGRDYQAGRTGLTSRQVNAQPGGQAKDAGAYPPIGPREQLFAVTAQAAHPEQTAHTGQTNCPTTVFLETNAGQFTAYSLVGGP